jgi:hypothetical protein
MANLTDKNNKTKRSKLYKWDPAQPPGMAKFWDTVPWVLASLLTTYLTHNQVGGEEHC